MSVVGSKILSSASSMMLSQCSRSDYCMHFTACLAPGCCDFRYLSGNSFTGSLPKSWSLLTKLVNLQVNDNRLTGTLPAGYSRLTALVSL